MKTLSLNVQMNSNSKHNMLSLNLPLPQAFGAGGYTAHSRQCGTEGRPLDLNAGKLAFCLCQAQASSVTLGNSFSLGLSSPLWGLETK